MSNKKIAELLAVLDMTKFEQKDWVRHNSMPYLWRGSLADLAFRLRDEVANGKLKIANGDTSAWYVGLQMVEGYLGESSAWLMHRSKPIHWIIAALIAKEFEGKG